MVAELGHPMQNVAEFERSEFDIRNILGDTAFAGESPDANGRVAYCETHQNV